MNLWMTLFYSAFTNSSGCSQNDSSMPLRAKDHSCLCIWSLAVLDVLNTLAVKTEIWETDMPSIECSSIPLIHFNYIVDEFHIFNCMDLIFFLIHKWNIESNLCNLMYSVTVCQFTFAFSEKNNYGFICKKLWRYLMSSFQKAFEALDSTMIYTWQ